MPLKIIEANIQSDIEIFKELLNRNRAVKVGKNRFEWLYLDNPTGNARAWIAIDEKTDQAVAFTSVLPRLAKVKGEEIVCWNCCDFSVDKKYRTLGVALKLRRKAKECVESGAVRALYAHPNEKMSVIHQKVGHHCIGNMIRYVKIIRTDAYIDRRVKSRFYRPLLKTLSNPLLKAMDLPVLKTDKQFWFERIGDGKYGREFDELFEKAASWYPIIADRRSEYLNWRYGSNPLYRTEGVTIRSADNGLLGYLIYYMEDDVAVFKDILCVPDQRIIKSLLRGWIKCLRQVKASSISAVFMDKNPMIRYFQKMGFRKRPDESAVFAYARENDPIWTTWINGENWYMTVGDRDV